MVLGLSLIVRNGTMFLDLVLPLWLSVCAPPESAGEAAPAPAPAPVDENEKSGHATRHDLESVKSSHQFVFNADVGTSAIVIFPVPSLDLSAFFGTTLPKLRQRRASHWTAVGLRVMGSYGVILTDTALNYFNGGLHTHLTITGAAGRRGRFAYSAGLGPIFGLGRARGAHGPPSPYGMEVEARFGYLFGDSRSSRVRGMFGGLFRFSTQLTGNEILPAPMLGLFLGIALVPMPVR